MLSLTVARPITSWLSVGSEGATLLPDKEALISQVRVCKLGADLAVHLPVVHHIGLVR